MINISVCSCISYLLLFIIYKSMIMHFLLVSCIGFGDSHSSCASQASRPLQAPECPHGVPPHHGVCLTLARWGGPQGPPSPGQAGRSVAQCAEMARP